VENTQSFLAEREAEHPDFNEMLQHFFEWQFGIGILELLDCIDHVSKFFKLSPLSDLPSAIRSKKDATS